MVKYYIATNDEDFILEVPEGDNIQVVWADSYGNQNEMRIVERKSEQDGEYVKWNDHILARYEGVVSCRCEHVKRVDPEVA